MTGPLPSPAAEPAPDPSAGIVPPPCWREVLAAALDGRIGRRMGVEPLLDRLEGRAIAGRAR